MKLDLELSARQQSGLDAQLAAYNAGQPEGGTLTAEQFVAALILPQIDAIADRYDPATTSDASVVRAAVKADPTATKTAIEAKEAEVAASLELGGAAEAIKP